MTHTFTHEHVRYSLYSDTGRAVYETIPSQRMLRSVLAFIIRWELAFKEALAVLICFAFMCTIALSAMLSAYGS